jgi:hypothetical protein
LWIKWKIMFFYLMNLFFPYRQSDALEIAIAEQAISAWCSSLLNVLGHHLCIHCASKDVCPKGISSGSGTTLLFFSCNPFGISRRNLTNLRLNQMPI